MTAPGGDSAKLGNRYEGIWAVDVVLKILDRRYEWILPEPIDDPEGIEFVAFTATGRREFHSAKRQFSKGEWTAPELSRPGKNRRSILRDLARRVLKDRSHEAVFVSGTTAFQVEQLVEEAAKHCHRTEFENALTKSERDNFALLECNLGLSRDEAFEFLKRLQVVLINEPTLQHRVDGDIDRLLVRDDGTVVDAKAVRLKLADEIVSNHRKRLDYDHFINVLRKAEYSIADWQTASDVASRLRERSESYRQLIDDDLIAKRFIERPHFATAVDELLKPDGKKFVIVEGGAGVGKSCFISAIVARLMSESVPVLAVRIDDATGANSKEDFGHRLVRMWKSPVSILAGIANGRRCVLVLDQLDAVSEFSGRDRHLRDLFEQLRTHAEHYPQMRVLLGCRTVDLESDRRLKALTVKEVSHQRLKLERLNEGEVRECLAHSQIPDAGMSATMIDVLRTPLHLRLFFETLEDNQRGFRSSIELFERYWDLRRREVGDRLKRDAHWDQVLDRLIDALRSSRSLMANEEIFDNGNLTDDARAMASCNVLVSVGRRYRFFHEAFYDYCAARRLSLRRLPQTTLFDLMLADGDQDLSVRSALRQMFQFNREKNFETYLADLNALLRDDRVRFHLKAMLIQWLGTLDAPKPVEWKVLESHIGVPEIGGRLLWAIRLNLAWFDVLDDQGTIGRWLNSEADEDNDKAVMLMSEQAVLQHRSTRVAELIAPFYGRTEAWNCRVVAMLRGNFAHCSRLMFDLFLRAIDDGLISGKRTDELRDFWSMLVRADDEAPELCAEAIAHWIDKLASAWTPEDRCRLFDSEDSGNHAELLIQKVAKDAPRAFFELVARRLIQLIETHTDGNCFDGLRLDGIFGLSNALSGISGQLQNGLQRSLKWMAIHSPESIEELVASFAASDIESFIHLAVGVWTAMPEKYSHVGIEYFISNPQRLTLGYGGWAGEDTGYAAVARKAIAAFLPFIDDELFQRFESTVLSLEVRDESGDWSLLYRYLLLMTLEQRHLSDSAMQTLEALKAMFPEFDTRIVKHRAVQKPRVLSPIQMEVAERLTNDEWIAMMERFNFDSEQEHNRDNKHVQAVELSRQLTSLVRTDRRRFAELALKMPSEIKPLYFEALLEGLAARWEQLSPEERQKDNADIQSLPMPMWCEVIEKLHGLGNQPCGRSICDALEALAAFDLPDRLLEIVSWYAIHDPDPRGSANPETEDGRRESVNHGINTIRGRAAHAIFKLLEEDFDRMAQLRPAVESLVQDRSIAVRSVAIACLFPILNHNRDEAVRLFRLLSEDQPQTWATMYWEHFLGYACHSHYIQLRPLLQRAAQSDEAEVATAGARRMTLGCLQNFDEFEPDMEWLLQQSPPARIGVADVLAANVVDDEVGEFVRRRVMPLFHDCDPKVRQEAASCFSKLEVSQLQTHQELVEAFRDSAAFDLDHNPLLWMLDESAERVPETTLSLIDRFMERANQETGRPSQATSIDSSHVTNLLFRIYEQDSTAETRRKCLDLIDRMMQLGFYNISSKLNAVDS